MANTKGINPDKAKRRPNTWNPSPVKGGKGVTQSPKKSMYRKQGR